MLGLPSPKITEQRNLQPLELLDQLRGLPGDFFYTIHRNGWPVALGDVPVA